MNSNLCINIKDHGDCRNPDCKSFHPTRPCVSGYNCKFKHLCTYKHLIEDRIRWKKNSIIGKKNDEIRYLDQRNDELQKTIDNMNKELTDKNKCIEKLNKNNQDLLKEIENLRIFNTKLIDTNSNLNDYLIEDISKKRKSDDCTNIVHLRKSPRFSNK